MKASDKIKDKIVTLAELKHRVAQWRVLEKKVAFTNGVFDIIHQGHLESLSAAAKEGDYLIVAINSDASIKRLKGSDRPKIDEYSRAVLLASLVMVDVVIIFDEDTPIEVIKAVMPNVLVKGGDYTKEQIVGAKEVEQSGGKIVINPLLEGFSTSSIINRIRNVP